MKNCIIVAGVNGEIGKEYVQAFLQENDVIAISRHSISNINHPNFVSKIVDLTIPQKIETAFADFLPEKYDSITLVHCIGKDKFENTQYPKIEPLPTLDSVVYASNVNTYKYFARFLIKKVEKAQKIKPVKLKLVIIGSVADKYGLLVITSYSESKNIVRSYIRDAVSLFPWISGLVVNISSTRTSSALEVRPYADTTYWLTPEEVVARSAKDILSKAKGYKEINIYKKDPGFTKNYYSDDEAIFKRWAKYVWGK